MGKIYKILLLFFFNMDNALARDASDAVFDRDRFIAEGAIELFREGCLKYYTRQAGFDVWTRLSKFRVYPDFATQRFIKDPHGKVYSVTYNNATNNFSVEYVLAVETDNLCAVFIKDVNPDIVYKSFAKLSRELTEANTILNIESRVEKLADGSLNTTRYTYTENGKWKMTLETREPASSRVFFDFQIRAISQARADNRK
jgi:hypothetical protein